MQQRAKMKPLTPARQALKLLVLRDAVRAELGSTYAEKTEPFRPFVATAFKQLGCPVRAAAHVVSLLQTQITDVAAQRLVTCAALDVAMGEPLALAS